MHTKRSGKQLLPASFCDKINDLLLLVGLGNLNEAQGGALHELAIEGDVDAVVAGLLEAKALEVHDEVAGQESSAFGKSHLEVTHDGHALLIEGSAVFVHAGNAKLVVTGVLGGHAEAESQSAGGVDDGKLTGEESIEGALHAELALIIGGVVAKDCNLDIHGIIDVVNEVIKAL